MGIQPRLVPFICDSCLRTIRSPRNTRALHLKHQPAATCITTSPSRSIKAHRIAIVPATASTSISRTSYTKITQRAYSSTSSLPTNIAESGVAPLPHRRLISLSGPDAPKFLQGLVTKNIDPTDSEPVYSAFLDARGRVLWDIFIWRWPAHNSDEWNAYIEIDGGEVDSCLRHLKKHKLRSKIKLEVVPEENVNVWSCWGVGVANFPPSSMLASLTDPRAPGFGTRFLLQTQAIPEKEVIDMVDTQQYHLRRYLYGIPEGPREIQRESALPMECNIDLSEGIDFRKGCYVGQELTIRTKHTGVVRKRILPVQLYHADSPVPHEDATPHYDPNWKGEVAEGTDIKQLAEEGSIKKGRATGKFISGIGNVGLAMCRLEMMTPMRVSAEGGTYKRGSEFGLQVSDEQGEKPMRIKAFVPRWLKERESQVWEKGRQRHI